MLHSSSPRYNGSAPIFSMSDFANSYLGRLRGFIGNRLVLMPGARLVLNDGARVFLQRRADFGKWGFISGSPEEGESLTDMIIREAREEAGISIDRPNAFGFSSDPELTTIVYPNGDRCQYFVMMYACARYSGQARVADNESTHAEWFAFDALPGDCMPNVRPTMDTFHKWRATGKFQLLD